MMHTRQSDLAYRPMEQTPGFSVPHLYIKLRRFVEILAILIASPVIILACLMVVLAMLAVDGRPFFFSQERPGMTGRVFILYKFRTMYVNSDDSYLTLSQDPRVTRIGKFLRRYKLDELPQLLNVLKGDMSLIGPRPVPMHFYQLYLENIERYDLRHSIKPGITGLAQVKLGYTVTIDEEKQKLKYDLKYISRMGLGLDLYILIKTFTGPKSLRETRRKK